MTAHLAIMIVLGLMLSATFALYWLVEYSIKLAAAVAEPVAAAIATGAIAVLVLSLWS